MILTNWLKSLKQTWTKKSLRRNGKAKNDHAAELLETRLVLSGISFTSSATPSVPENTINVVDVNAEDGIQTISFSISGGDDAARFDIDGLTGQLSFKTAPNFESPTDTGADNVYEVEIRAENDLGEFEVQLISVSVTAANDNSPVITSAAAVSINENTTATLTVTATDADSPSPTFIYSIQGGADAAKFTIDSSTGVLSFSTAPDYETPTDSDGNNTYIVRVAAADATTGVIRTGTKVVTVTVLPVNDNSPVFTTGESFNVAENTTAVTTVAATDADLPGQTVTFSITGGVDGGLFSITSGGVLTFVSAPDYENPADDDTDNVYEIEVTANDGNGGTTVQSISITVTPVNDNSPVFTTGESFNVAENTTAVTTVAATDADIPGQTVTFSITGGVDGGLFSITSGGVLTFVSAPDYENPADDDTDNVYEIEVTANDGNGGTTLQSISVTVTPVNDNSPVFTTGESFNVAENTTAVTTVAATDADLPGQTVTFSITGGVDGGLFSITSGGVLTFVSAPDYENPADDDTDNVYEIEVTANDGNGGTTVQSISVTVTPVNDNSPVFTTGESFNVAENTTAVTTVAATDADIPGQTVTFTITGGVDASLFSITSGGVLTFVSAPDYENPADDDTDNVYEIEVTANDGNGGTTLQSISVTVTPVNDNSPVFTTGESFNVAENTTAVTTVAATDADIPGQTVTFTITGGVDASLFSITSGGVLTFVSAPDYENPADDDTDNVYEIEVTANDGNGGTTLQSISVTVTPVNDNSPVFTTGESFNVAENTTAVTTVAATDADLPGQTVTFSITGGVDASLFSITSGGVLTFVSAPDYENPADDDTDNVYEIEVTANDGNGGTTVQSISVTVTPVNDNSPVFTTGESFNVAENTTAVTTVAATDADLPGQTITFSITGGVDGGLFSITSGGVLTFVSAPDYENPADDDTDNVYEIEVTANDGNGGTTLQSISVTVTPVNDNSPVFTTGESFNVAENTTAVTTVAATDADLPGQTVTFSITGGVDGGLFSITSGGVLTFVSAPDYENPADDDTDNVYEIEVTANDGNGGTTVQSISVTVTPVNDNSPVFTTGESFNVAENTTAVTTVAATDADLPGQTVTFSITGGVDGGLFSITSGGVLTFVSAPDYENPADDDTDNVYEIEVTANDGNGGTTVQSISVTVTPVNDNSPVFTTGESFNVAENTTAVTTVAATDADIPGQTVTFSITGGVDGGLFSITSGGVLTFVSAPDYENPADDDTDNVYEIEVTANDGNGGTTVQSISVTVTPVNDNSPVFTTGESFNVAENTTAVTTVAATDADIPGQTVTFSITGGADQAKFSITSGGVLTFSSAPNYEAPTDVGANNVYEVQVTANDGNSGTTVQNISVTVTPVNDNNPVFTSNASQSVPENTTAVTTVTATDADLPGQTVTFSITGGDDAAKFTITSGGALSFNSAPDYENPTDVGTNNVYEVQVTANDGNGGTTVQNISVTVTALNDNNPVFTTGTAFNVAENTTAVTTVAATDADVPGQTVTFSLTGGADLAKFSITSGGVLTFLTAPNFEAPTDVGANNVYNVQVTANDGNGGTTVQNIAVTVTNANEAPTITSASTANVAENATAVLTLTSTDPESDSITYSITGGADQARFSIAGNALSFSPAPNFEAPTDADTNNVYVVQVTANDGNGHLVNQTITVTVTPVNEFAPVITSSATFSQNENISAVTTVTATDADLPAPTITFSITGGADAAKFTISPSGALSFVSAPNFEAPTDAGGNNVYDVVVRATDGTLSSTQAIAVTILNTNDPPVVSAPSGINHDENQVSVTNITTSDTDGDTVTLSITGGSDASKFTLVGNTLTFIDAPNYEAPTDSNTNNTYVVQVTGNDGNGGLTTITITVNVTDVDESIIIDQASATGYSETGSWKNKASLGPAGYLGNLRYAHPNTTTYSSNAYDNGVQIATTGSVEFGTADVDTATYTFSGLDAGTYQVAVTWKNGSNRATNASFTVAGTGVSSQTVVVNQQNAPNSFTTNAGLPNQTTWRTLVASFGSITAGGTITVTLTSAGANGYVISDAVRLERVGPLVAADGPAANPSTETLTNGQLQSVAQAAIAKWKSVGLTSAQLALLNSVSFEVADLPTGELGAQTNTAIYLDTNAAGYGWFVDTTPKSNREFKKTSSASELKAKENSAAFGKMDLLTVVMHELGHRMGFGHTSDPTNLMAEDLDVGTRRVPLTERAEARAASSARTAIRIASSNGGQSTQGDTGAVAVDSTPDTGTADIITPTVTSESKGRSKSRLFGRIGKQAKLAADATDLDQLFSGDFGGLLETDER